jgi:GNAT superfamily N-acetyltransferase
VKERLDVPGFDLEIDTDPARIDVALVHTYLSRDSYWAKGMPEALLRKAIANSMCFGVYERSGGQLAFCRVITDRSTFAWLSDVFVLPEHQGKGISKAFMAKVFSHPDLQGLRRFMLSTKDAHSLYARFGFKEQSKPERYMEILQPGIYSNPGS